MSDEITIKAGFSDLRILSVALLVASLIVAGAVLYTGNNIATGLSDVKTAGALGAKTAAAPAPSPAPTPSPSPSADPDDGAVVGNIDLTGASVQGSANAKVTIVEFSDFQCPFCARFYEGAYPDIKTNYIDTGKVKLAFKNFPLSFHQYAQKASEAAECAADQGKFWEYHDKLFENQDKLTTTDLKKYAAGLGLDTVKFNACLDGGIKASKVQADFQQGVTAGVRGTPSFVINGKLLVGAQPYDVFKQTIDAELAKAG